MDEYIKELSRRQSLYLDACARAKTPEQRAYLRAQYTTISEALTLAETYAQGNN